MKQILHPVIEMTLKKYPEFKYCLEKLFVQCEIKRLSKRTLISYSRKLAQLTDKFGKMPENCSLENINDYLASMNRQGVYHSESDFKLAIAALKLYWKAIGREELNIKLPKVKRGKVLPVVLNKEEIKILFKSVFRYKDEVLLKTIYSAGLRVGELSELKLGDLDFQRRLIHIRQAKGKKDRYVCLSDHLMKALKNYMEIEKPYEYLFNNSMGGKLGITTISKIMRRAVLRSGILKKGVCLHTLRHSFATHLLEDGIDLLSIKALLGHEHLHTTMVYLHVTNYEAKIKKCSPLDKLFDNDVEEFEASELANELTHMCKQSIYHSKLAYAQVRMFD